MSNPFSDLFDQFKTASDWAIVLPIAVAGFTLDAAINVVPIPVFSPGVYGVTAGTVALSAKHGVEAVRQASRDKKRLELARDEAANIARQLRERGSHTAGDALAFISLITDDIERLLVAIDEGRAKL